ncbi:MAG TPA: hypothetical protein VHX13_00810 [Acidobacteriaceae bacterium]|jgi:hypothetical protein|nr:hypothetical protein [Acidobacteriaceae bacterium]
MKLRSVLLSALLATGAIALCAAQDQFPPLHGHCSIAPGTKDGQVRFELEEDACGDDHQDCHNHDSDSMPLSAFSGFTLSDLQREGAHLDAVISAEAGQLTCSGTVHDLTLSGDSTFVPNPGFVAQMRQMGFDDFDSRKLEAYTLFHIEISWIRSLQAEGIAGMDSGNLIALRIFKVDATYVREMTKLGYPHLAAGKLIAFKVQGVNPEEVRQYRTLGYQPSADELIQMRIFKVTPDFIQRMRAHGLGNLTISKLVQIRIFKLAD